MQVKNVQVEIAIYPPPESSAEEIVSALDSCWQYPVLSIELAQDHRSEFLASIELEISGTAAERLRRELLVRHILLNLIGPLVATGSLPTWAMDVRSVRIRSAWIFDL